MPVETLLALFFLADCKSAVTVSGNSLEESWGPMRGEPLELLKGDLCVGVLRSLGSGWFQDLGLLQQMGFLNVHCLGTPLSS